MGTFRNLFDRLHGRRKDAPVVARPRIEERATLPYDLVAEQVFAGRGSLLAGPLEIPAILRAVTLISGDLSRVPLECSDQKIGGLLEAPNRWQSGLEFRRSLVIDAATQGNGYAFIKTQGLEPVELVPWEPSDVSPTWDAAGLRYKHRNGETYDAIRVIHLRCVGSTGFVGSSPFRRCRTAVELIGRAIKVAHEKAAPGSTGKLFFTSPLPDQAQAWAKAFKQAFIEGHIKGSNRKDTDEHSIGEEPIVASDGVQAHRVGLTLEELTWKDVAAYSIDEVYRLSGVPVPYLSGTLAQFSPEQIGRLYVEGCLALWAAAFEAELAFKLGGTWAHDLDGLALPGFGELMAGCRTAIECGLETPDEVREDKLNKGPLPNGQGAEVRPAKNLGTGGGSTHAGVDTSKVLQ